MNQTTGRIRYLNVVVPCQRVNTQALARQDVVVKLHVAVIKRNVVESGTDTVSHQPPDVALAKGCEPRSVLGCTQLSFAKKFAIGDSWRQSKNGSSAAPLPRMNIQRCANLIAKLLR